ncbi:MAG: hypothetical protein JRN52_13095 [Nitrososphaerota archaeon]|nr:hypothetical protein [Nitrososphaerota archaeon]
MASKKCPLCGTKNDQSSWSCKNCGYTFLDDLGTTEARMPFESTLPKTQNEEQKSWDANPTPPKTVNDTFPVSSPPTQTGSPLFVVSKSLLASVAPAMVYLVFIFLLIGVPGSSLLSLGMILVFVLVAMLPVLFTTRKYEFYEDSLRMHKTIGGDSEIPYSELEMYDYPAGRRPRIILSATGQRRPIVIQGNPTNKELGLDLSQFLGKKLKKSTTQSGNQQTNPPSDARSTSTDEGSTNMT